jgi:hypothetical protein
VLLAVADWSIWNGETAKPLALVAELVRQPW